MVETRPIGRHVLEGLTRGLRAWVSVSRLVSRRNLWCLGGMWKSAGS